MTWFFAAVVVVLLTVVALVAVGRGGGLAEAHHDRPDVRLPDGPLSGADVRRVRFTTAFRGYRMSEVDALLDRLATQVETTGLTDERPPQPQRQPQPAQPKDSPRETPPPAEA